MKYFRVPYDFIETGAIENFGNDFLLAWANSGEGKNYKIEHSGFQVILGTDTNVLIGNPTGNGQQPLDIYGDAHILGDVGVVNEVYLLGEDMPNHANTRIWAQDLLTTGIFTTNQNHGIIFDDHITFYHDVESSGLSFQRGVTTVPSGEKFEFIKFLTSGETPITLDKSSNVGIFTNSPRYKVDANIEGFIVSTGGSVDGTGDAKILMGDGFIPEDVVYAISIQNGHPYADHALAIGDNAFANGIYSSAFGSGLIAYGDYSFAFGVGSAKFPRENYTFNPVSNWWYYESGWEQQVAKKPLTYVDQDVEYGLCYAESNMHQAIGANSCVFNGFNTAYGDSSFAIGFGNRAGAYSHVEGMNNKYLGRNCHIEGYSHSGDNMIADTTYLVCHIEGSTNYNISGTYSHIEGINNALIAQNATLSTSRINHLEGYGNIVWNTARSHAEGTGNVISSGFRDSVGGSLNQVYGTQDTWTRGRYNTTDYTTGSTTLGQGAKSWVNNGIHLASNYFQRHGDAMTVLVEMTKASGIDDWLNDEADYFTLKPFENQPIILPENSILNFELQVQVVGDHSGYFTGTKHGAPEWSWKSKGFVSCAENSNETVPTTFGLASQTISGNKYVTGVEPFMYYCPRSSNDTNTVNTSLIDFQDTFEDSANFELVSSPRSMNWGGEVLTPELYFKTGTREIEVRIRKLNPFEISGLMDSGNNQELRFSASLIGNILQASFNIEGGVEKLCVYWDGTEGSTTIDPPTLTPPDIPPPRTLPPDYPDPPYTITYPPTDVPVLPPDYTGETTTGDESGSGDPPETTELPSG